MKHLKHLFTALLLLCSIGMAKAHDFEAGGIYYNILSSTNKTVEVTYRGTYYNEYSNEYTGSVVIPESVTYNGSTYSVTSIGESAFEFCRKLTSITIPNSVKNIGEDAFYYCDGLTNVVIGNSVTSIGVYAFYYCTRLTSITIPNSVTNIGGGAFYDCWGLTSITIPNSVTSIGGSAFSGCTGLTSITIPNSITSIGGSAFKGTAWYNNQSDGVVYAGKVLYKYKGTMPANTSITINNGTLGIAGGAFSGCSGLTSITIPNSVTRIGGSAFSGCTSLTNITIPNCVTSIGESAFSGCTGLTNITIPNSVTSIGESAFSGCTGLTNITIPNSVTSIADRAFEGCTGLTNITIPNSVTSIGNAAFDDCKGLKELFIEDGEKTLSLGYNMYKSTGTGQGLFYDCPLETIYLGRNLYYNTYAHYGSSSFREIKTLKCVTIGNSVTSIGESAFYNCTGLTSIVIPNSVTNIGYSAFSGCTGLTSIEIPNSVTSIGNSAFSCCTGLTSIEIPNSVTSIGNSAFIGCTGLTSIKIPNSITSIGEDAFANCSGLTSITIPNSVTSIGDEAFYKCTGLTNITIPNSVTSIGDRAFAGCTRLKTVYNFSNLTFSKGSTNHGYVAYYADKVYNISEGFIENDFVLGKINGVNTLVGYLGNATKLTLPADYKGENYVIAADAFKGNTSLISIEIPNSVTSIEDAAFQNCTGLTHVEIGNSVTNIGYSAFRVCTSLTSIEIPNSVICIGKSAFFGCTGLTDITIPNSVTSIGDFAFWDCTGLTNVVIGNSVTSIGNAAFYNCSGLTSIAIPNSVTSIGSSAFYNCTGLTSVAIPNSVTSIGENGFEGCCNVETLYIGSSIESIGSMAFAACEKITEIKVALEKPIRVDANIFTDAVYDNATLYIPNGTEQLYQKREPWNTFFYIVEMDFTGISLSHTNLVLTEGNSFTLAAIITPSDSTDNPVITWTTSNSAVATVENGVVTAVAPGTTTITARAGNYSANCEIIVEARYIAVTDISLNHTNLTLAKGESLTLTATITPSDATDNTVTWTTSNSTVAIVENGVVTALAPGNATITARAGNYSANCEITVKKIITAISQLSNDQLYHISQPYHSWGATSWAVEQGGTALKSNNELGVEVAETNRRQHFAILSNDGGSTYYLYHAAEKKFVNKDGSLGTVPVDAINLTAGAYKNTFIFYFDNNHYINVGGGKRIEINGWKYPDGGNSCLIAPVDTFDSTEALGTITDIDEITEQKAEDKNIYYDLNGRAVESPTKGIYIINGKKVLVK